MSTPICATDRARVIAVCVSPTKGTVKVPVPEGRLVVEHGLDGDAHAGPWHRQVSLLSTSSIDKMKAMGLDVAEGTFAENLTVDGIDVFCLPIGTRILAGADAELVVTQIGKECHTGCAIMKAVGKCVMPHEGVFARVVKPGTIHPGDELIVLEVGRESGGIAPGAKAPAATASVRAGVITASDKGARGERVDESGPAIAAMLRPLGWQVAAYAVVADEQEQLEAALLHQADDLAVDVIFTTGGTGFSRRDVTPEATLAVVDRLAPGISEAIRAASLQHTPRAMLSRGTAGLRGFTLIVNLPGSPKAVQECLTAILPALPHGIAILRGEAAECARVE